MAVDPNRHDFDSAGRSRHRSSCCTSLAHTIQDDDAPRMALAVGTPGRRNVDGHDRKHAPACALRRNEPGARSDASRSAVIAPNPGYRPRDYCVFYLGGVSSREPAKISCCTPLGLRPSCFACWRRTPYPITIDCTIVIGPVAGRRTPMPPNRCFK